MTYDEIVVLPSGTELSIEAAQGDLSRAIEALCDYDSIYWGDLVSDLTKVAELLALLATPDPTDTKEGR